MENDICLLKFFEHVCNCRAKFDSPAQACKAIILVRVCFERFESICVCVCIQINERLAK